MMNDPGISAAADKVSKDVREYVGMRMSMARLSLVEGLSVVAGNAVRILLLIVFCAMGLMALMAGAIFALAIWLGSIVWASVIVGILCFIVGLVLFSMRKTFINPMVRTFSKMVFSHKPQEKHEVQ